MRVTVIATLAAMVVHAVAIAWFAAREPDAMAALPAQAPAPADTVVDVVLLDEPTPAPAPAPVAKPVVAHTPRSSPHALATATAATAPTPATATASDAHPTPPAHDIFAMRGPDISPSQIVDPAPAPREPDAAPGELRPAGLPRLARATKDSELRPAGDGTYTTDLGGSDWRDRTATAHVARDGTVTFDNAPDFDLHFAGLGFAGKFNADDWIMRKTGIDPYASAKLAYLDRTRDERARIAEVNRTHDLAHADRAMQRNLDVARAIADVSARKQALFELWDDVAETGDDALVHAGAQARAYLVDAIRAMRPALVFTPAELAQLNAHRHSRAVFAPYDSP